MTPKPRYDPTQLRWDVLKWSEESEELKGVIVPARFEAKLRHPNWPADLVISVEVSPDRGPVAVGIRSESPDVPYARAHAAISATYPMSNLLQDLTADATGVRAMIQAREAFGGTLGEDEVKILGGVARKVSDQAWPVSRPRRRRTVTPELLQEVADVYRAAIADGLTAPTAAVADHFVVSHSTAARWVGEARTAGVLGPARGTKPGEDTEGGEHRGDDQEG